MQLLGLCNKKHGETIKKEVTPEYQIFHKMMDRCNNPNNKKDYKDYGARGIGVCSEWLHNFKAFLNDMGRRPSSKHSIDRIDNNKGYSKNNCKWSTQIEQANNKRNSRILTYNSESFTVSQWARKLGIPRSSIDNRLRKNLSIDNVLTIRKYKSGSFKKYTA